MTADVAAAALTAGSVLAPLWLDPVVVRVAGLRPWRAPRPRRRRQAAP